jgi:hypothetical protein
MTDLEISKALALAIGWDDVFITASKCLVGTQDELRNKVKINSYWLHGVRTFDYRDWNVIGPIAAKYDCFPWKVADSWLSRYQWRGCGVRADTPQKAIALAVIGGLK